MNYIENIYICLAAPMLLSIICLRGRLRRATAFLLAGMTACLLASYISTFFAEVTGADALWASLEISPVVEEMMKFAPLLFWLLVYEPEKEDAYVNMIVVALGFATFENVCYLTSVGAERLILLLIRGLGTGAMHVVCGMIVSRGLFYLWDKFYLRVAGTAGLISAAITFHAVYNVLVSQTGVAAVIGYALPLVTAAALMLIAGDRGVKA